jgi:SAM-dependent methyltransferase
MSGYDFVKSEEEPHLGGNIWQGDPWTFSPGVWRYMIDRFAVRSILDVGSGRGHAANWFHKAGCQVIAIDGEQENVDNAFYPTIRHDLTERNFLTKVDMVHCVEVVEHIKEEHMQKLMWTLTNGDVVIITHAEPGQPGHHHVNCQPASYWIGAFDKYAYNLLDDDTKRVRNIASHEGAYHMARYGLVFGNRRKI